MAVDGRSTLILCGLLVAVFAFPLWLVEVPPLWDYPSHVARVHMMAEYDEVPQFREFYEIAAAPVPNLAFDLIGTGLAGLFGAELAAKIFLTLAFALQATGPAVLARVLRGRWTVWPVLLNFFLINWILYLGFLNYVFGVGLLIWALAGWFSLRPRPILYRVLAGTAFSLALYFCHLTVLGLFALAVAAIEIEGWVRGLRRAPVRATRDLALAACIFVPPVLLALTWSTSAPVDAPSLYSPWTWKIKAVFYTMTSGNLTADLVFLAAGAVLLPAVALSARIRFATVLIAPLAAMTAAYLALPTVMLGGLNVDNRLPIAILLVFIAGLDVSFRRAAVRHAVAAALIAVMLVRAGFVVQDWRAYDRVAAEFRDLQGLLPDGSVVLTVQERFVPDDLPREFPNTLLAIYDHRVMRYWHLPSLAVLDRPVFVARIFADPAQQPIVARPSYRAWYRFQQVEVPPVIEDRAGLQAIVDGARRLSAAAGAGPVYLVLLTPQDLGGADPDGAEPVRRAGPYTLLRIDLGGAG